MTKLPRRPTLITFTAAELAIRQMPPARFVVPRFVTEGLTLLGGRPKVGKSWLLMNIALAVATGRNILGEQIAVPGDVLLLALEDNERRLQARLNLMLAGEVAPSRLHLATVCPALDQGGLAAIRDWCRQLDNPRLIIVDVFARVRPRAQPGARLYEADYDSALPLKTLADELELGIIACTHTRKEPAAVDPFDSISATTGLAGAADSILILDRNTTGPTLYGRGRDMEEVEVALAFERSTGTWKLIGDAVEVNRSDERNAIIAVLTAADQPLSPKQIAERSGLGHASVKHLVRRLVTTGEITKSARGTYSSAGNPVHPVHSVHSLSQRVTMVNGVNGTGIAMSSS
jgi:hypothetical protein